jgi:GH15 family glucan-1,4-alpha-glucosidase
LPGPLARWQALRTRIHDEVCSRGFDAGRNTFTQYYGSQGLDASLLLIPLVGFLPASDPRVSGTLAAIERELLHDGYVARYDTAADGGVDGLPGTEGAFLACTFWLADNHAVAGRPDRAREIFERLLDLRNDVGLLAEEYDPVTRRQVGNFPQAFSHVPLVNTARNLSAGDNLSAGGNLSAGDTASARSAPESGPAGARAARSGRAAGIERLHVQAHRRWHGSSHHQ